MNSSTDLVKDWERVMECAALAEQWGAELHALGRSDGDYHTDDHDRAAECLHLSTRDRDLAMRAFIKDHGAALLNLLKKKR